MTDFSGGILFIGITGLALILILTVTSSLLDGNNKHKPFCDSIGLEFDGYPSGIYYQADAISCSGVNVDGTGVFKVFLFDESGYHEVIE